MSLPEITSLATKSENDTNGIPMASVSVIPIANAIDVKDGSSEPQYKIVRVRKPDGSIVKVRRIIETTDKKEGINSLSLSSGSL